MLMPNFGETNKVHMGDVQVAYQLTLLALCKFVSPKTYPSRGIRWLLCECELNTICNNNWTQSNNKGLILFVIISFMLTQVKCQKEIDL